MSDEMRHNRREIYRSLWFLPAIFVSVALLSGYLLSKVELGDGVLSSLVFQGSASGARELLTVVSGTMITVTGLVFVLTVVALQIASTQFSLRLLRSFLQDTGTRLVLAVFVATFAYSLGGLFTVGQKTQDGELFVPRLAVTGSLILALLSVGMLVYYIQHITDSIRIDTIMVGVRRATLESIRRNFPRPVTEAADPRPPRPVPPGHAAIIPCQWSGYIQELDIEALIRVARDTDVTIGLRHQLAQHVIVGAPLAWVWAEDPTADVDLDRLTPAVNRAVVRAHERRVDEDVGFGLRQLVDIAVRAVSVSTNDPYTAVQAIQHLTVLLAELGVRAIEDEWHYEGERLRVYAPVPSFELFLDIVCGNIRRNAGNRPRVLIEIFRMLETVALVGTPASRRAGMAERAKIIMGDAERTIPLDQDVEWVRSHAERAIHAAETGQLAVPGGRA